MLDNLFGNVEKELEELTIWSKPEEETTEPPTI